MKGLYTKIGGTFVLRAFGLALAFVFQIILGRILNPELYGKFTMFITYGTIISIFSVWGLDRNLIKDVAKLTGFDTKSNMLLQFSLLVSTFMAVILSSLVIIFQAFIKIPTNTVFAIIILVFVKTYAPIVDGFMQGYGLVVKSTFLSIVVNNILKMLLFAVLIFTGFDLLMSAIYSFIFSEIIALIIRWIIIKKVSIPKLFSKIDMTIEEKKKFIKYTIMVGLISIVSLLIQNVDKIIISEILDDTSVGIYKVSQNYMALLAVFISPFIAFWPVISKLYSENKIFEIEKEMKRIVLIITYLIIPMFFIFIFQKEKLLLIFGDEYVTKESSAVLVILSFAYLVDAISGPIGSILTMTKHAKIFLYNNIVSLILNIILSFIFIKTYGIIGVAIGTGISLVVSNIISIVEVKLLLGIFSYDYKNLLQIVTLSVANTIICICLYMFLKIENLYLYLLIFGFLVYLINGVIYTIINYRKINEFLISRNIIKIRGK